MKPGSIILVKSKGFIPAQIRKHMAIWAKMTGREPLPWNHAETIVRYRGHLVSMGARANGAEITPLDEYLKTHPDYIILEPVKELTENELVRLEMYCEHICFKDKRPYQNFMFLAWVHKIKTWGLMQWGNKTDKRVYCYELAARCCQLLDRWPGDINLISVYELYENPNFKKI